MMNTSIRPMTASAIRSFTVIFLLDFDLKFEGTILLAGQAVFKDFTFFITIFDQKVQLYSNSVVAGGFGVMSKNTRTMSLCLVKALVISSMISCGK